MNGWQGTSWSKELDGKELHGALGGECGMEPRGFPFFLYTESTLAFRASTKKCGILKVFKRWCFD